METTLNSDISYRSNLWQPENLAETGTDVNTPPLCTPVADCNPTEKYICLGDVVTFTDFSWRAPVTSWLWSFPGGSSSMLTSANPVVTYTTPGWHDVTLTVTNAAGSDTKTFTNAVYVSNSYPDFVGATVEDFENAVTEPWWISDNQESNYGHWARIVTSAAPSGTHCFMLNNHKDPSVMDPTYFDRLGGSMDALISPSYDLSLTSSPVLSFKYSYATHATLLEDLTETLKVFVSYNCGKTWIERDDINGVELANAGVASGSYAPANGTTAFWKTVNVNLGPGAMQPNVRFKFEFTASDHSNNLYIDDINVNGVNGLAELTQPSFSFNVYPNPVDHGQSLSVVFDNEEGSMKLVLQDVVGNILFSKTVTDNGTNMKMDIPLSQLQVAKGVYVVSMSNDSHRQAKRIVVD
jgi:PKD repeat protein